MPDSNAARIKTTRRILKNLGLAEILMDDEGNVKGQVTQEELIDASTTLSTCLLLMIHLLGQLDELDAAKLKKLCGRTFEIGRPLTDDEMQSIIQDFDWRN